MGFKIGLPPASIYEDKQSMVNYMFKLVKELNSALSSIDEDNFSPQYQRKINAVSDVADKAQQLADMLDKDELAKTKNVRDKYQELKDEIFSKSNDVTGNFISLLSKTDTEIRGYVEENYIASDPNSTLEQTFSSLFKQEAKGITATIESLSTLDVEGIKKIVEDISTYFDFTIDGLEIGKIGSDASQIVVRIKNDKIEFALIGTDVVILYIDAVTNKIHINRAEVDNISIGNEDEGYFNFDMQSDGLFVKWSAGDGD